MALHKKRHLDQLTMKILYVGYILPMEVSKALGTSIAADKFEHLFIRRLMMNFMETWT